MIAFGQWDADGVRPPDRRCASHKTHPGQTAQLHARKLAKATSSPPFSPSPMLASIPFEIEVGNQQIEAFRLLEALHDTRRDTTDDAAP
jgi:hypothetical protein